MVKLHFLHNYWSDVNHIGSYDHLMIVYPIYVLYDQWPFCLVAMATLTFEKRNFLNDNSFKTTEAVWL